MTDRAINAVQEVLDSCEAQNPQAIVAAVTRALGQMGGESYRGIGLEERVWEEFSRLWPYERNGHVRDTIMAAVRAATSKEAKCP